MLIFLERKPSTHGRVQYGYDLYRMGIFSTWKVETVWLPLQRKHRKKKEKVVDWAIHKALQESSFARQMPS